MTASFTFTPMGEHDLAMMREWLLRPHVAEWWGPAQTIDELREDYVLHVDEPNATRAYVVRREGEPIGFIQAYVVLGSGDGWWEDATDPGARGIDQFIAVESLLSRGIGRAMIGAFLDELFADPAVTVIQTDPRPDNPRAIRCYTAAGFEPVSVVDTPDGPAWLMRCTRESRARAKASTRSA